jgi:hypothetical protein
MMGMTAAGCATARNTPAQDLGGSAGAPCGETRSRKQRGLAEETRCIVSFERSFMRPVLAGEP